MIDYDLTNIKAIVFDVDGVLSRQTISMDAKGEPLRTINIQDGYAIQLACKLGLHIAIITGGNTPNIRLRYEYLGVKDIFLGRAKKLEVYDKFLHVNGIDNGEVLYMGDDIPDYEVMKRCGCPCCPADASPDIKAISRYISHRDGGDGCARDVIEQVLRAQGKWLAGAEAFGW